jgi:hypothetical protein
MKGGQSMRSCYHTIAHPECGSCADAQDVAQADADRVTPDQLEAAALQDARDATDPGPDELGSVSPLAHGNAWKEAHAVPVEDDETHPITGAPPDWRDRYDTREEWKGER